MINSGTSATSTGGDLGHMHRGEELYSSNQHDTVTRTVGEHLALQPNHGQQRGSLGQFIERSTSAPPPSSTTLYGSSSDRDSALVGTVSELLNDSAFTSSIDFC